MIIDKDKSYWLYIASHVHYYFKNEQILLYNTNTGAYMESDTKEIIALMQELHQKQNFGAIYMEGKKLIRAPYNFFIAEFCIKKMGELVDSRQEKPIQLMPVLNLQRDVEKLQKDKERFTGEGLLNYLLEINIYINETCDARCILCKTYFLQNLCCTVKNEQQLDLSKTLLQNILTQIQYANVGKINILGGNILQYANYDELESILQPSKERIHLWLCYLNADNSKTLLSGFKYDIPVTFPVNEQMFTSCLKQFSKEQATYHFFITGEKDYNQAKSLLDTYAISDYKLHPVYTGENISFFKDEVYMTKQDVFSTTLSFREIFAHQKLNTNFFGSLNIMSNGNVYANINNPLLGNVETDSLLELINKEINTNTSWRVIRNEPPCNDCLYQYLCPSPSNYETVIGKPNLCHVHP